MSKFKREFKNVVYNYTDAEAKVREATSNDPWGPSSSIMSELSEYTYHVQAYGLVMGMLWKRLNDHGKNWRHVYKSLVVLDYLIKTGSERVTAQCKENLFSIQTLKDFQYVDKDGKDQGANIREKAKALVALLKDDDHLKEERRKAQQARVRQTGLSSQQAAARSSPKSQNKVTFSGSSTTTTDGASAASPDRPHRLEQNVEQARPNDQSEEELQLKLALQLSKQQAEEDERIKSQEDESLRAALELSKHDVGSGVPPAEGEGEGTSGAPDQQPSDGGNLLLDFSETGLADPWSSAPPEPPPSYDTLVDPFASSSQDPFGTTTPVVNSDPFATATAFTTSDPFATTTSSVTSDPFAPASSASVAPTSSASVDLFAGISSSVGLASTTSATSWTGPPPASNNSTDFWSAGGNTSVGGGAPPTSSAVSNPFDLSTLGGDLPPLTATKAESKAQGQGNRIEDQFLGSNLGNLVDLDSLTIPPPILNNPNPNPFGGPPTSSVTANPFDVNKPTAPSLNQMVNSGFTAPELLPPPLIPGTSPRGGSPILPHTAPQPQYRSQPNPFS